VKIINPQITQIPQIQIGFGSSAVCPRLLILNLWNLRNLWIKVFGGTCELNFYFPE
jgi:hypothetical protein